MMAVAMTVRKAVARTARRSSSRRRAGEVFRGYLVGWLAVSNPQGMTAHDCLPTQRFGDLLPLPLPSWLDSSLVSGPWTRTERRRLSRHKIDLAQVDESVFALNVMGGYDDPQRGRVLT